MHAFRSVLIGIRTTAHGFRYASTEIRSLIPPKTALYHLPEPPNCPDFGQPPFLAVTRDGSC